MKNMTKLVFFESISSFVNEEHTLWGSSKWFHSREMQVYLRNGPRCVENQIVQCITISNVSVHESYQGTGVYSRFLDMIERISIGKLVYIENVLDTKQRTIYLNRGYTMRQDDIICDIACFYKEPK